MNGRHSERPPRRDTINLISGLGGWFCGSAVVVGGAPGLNSGRFGMIETTNQLV
jgi:hypothetical protein